MSYSLCVFKAAHIHQELLSTTCRMPFARLTVGCFRAGCGSKAVLALTYSDKRIERPISRHVLSTGRTSSPPHLGMGIVIEA